MSTYTRNLALRGSWHFAEKTLSSLSCLLTFCDTFSSSVPGPKLEAFACTRVAGTISTLDLSDRIHLPHIFAIMNGITSMSTASTRACYYRHFSELIARVRNAKRATPKNVENFGPILNGELNPRSSFPLPGTMSSVETLSKPVKLKPLIPAQAPSMTILTDYFHNVNFADSRIAALQMHADLDAYQTKMASAEQARPLRIEVDHVEFMVNDCNEKLRKSFGELFPSGFPATSEEDFCAITISHRTENDMSAWSVEMEQEREELTKQFVTTAKEIVEALRRNGVWADFIDPSSGRPFYSPYTNATLFETDDRLRNFGFRVQDLGCCKALEHPVWGGNVFVGCLFATTSSRHPVLREILQNQAN